MMAQLSVSALNSTLATLQDTSHTRDNNKYEAASTDDGLWSDVASLLTVS
jgi:hypothetical protein